MDPNAGPGPGPGPGQGRVAVWGTGGLVPADALLGKYEIARRGDERGTVVAELRHVSRNKEGGSVTTPIGWISAAFVPWEGESREHWRARLFLLESRRDLRDKRLPEALVEWLERAIGLAEPFVLETYEAHYLEHISRGKLLDDDD